MKKNENARTDDEEKRMLKAIVNAYNSDDADMKGWAIQEMMSRVNGFIGHMIDKHFAVYKKQYYDDMFSEGSIAVVEEMGRFDPDKGTLTTFFTRYILHRISNFIDAEINRSTPYYSNIMNAIKDAKKYFDELHVQPTISDIALHTGLSVKKVEDGLKRIEATNEQYYAVDSDLDAMVKKSFESPEDDILRKERIETLRQALSDLEERDRLILGMRFGVDNEEQKSYSMIGKALGMHPNQVMRSVNRSIRILSANQDLRKLEGIGQTKRKRAALSHSQMSVMPDADILQIYAAIDENTEAEISIKIRSKADTDFEMEEPIILSL